MGIRIHLVGSKNVVYNNLGHGYLLHVRIANRTYPGLLPRLTGRQRFCSEMTHLTLAELRIDGARVALCGNGQPLPPGRWVFVEGKKTPLLALTLGMHYRPPDEREWNGPKVLVMQELNRNSGQRMHN